MSFKDLLAKLFEIWLNNDTIIKINLEMVKVRKFWGYLANKDSLDKIISPPYDVCTVQEGRDWTGDNDMYYFHIEKPAVDLPDTATDQEIAEKGKENLLNFIKNGYLEKDDWERIYIYSQQMGDHIQFGIVCLSSIDDYENNNIKKHEHTIPETVLERTNLCDIQCANASPVFFSFKGGDDIQNRIKEIIEAEPYGRCITKDKVIHTVWRWTEEDSDYIVKAFEDIESTYIADGHHRSAAAFNVGLRRRMRAMEQGVQITGDEDFNFFLTVIFPESHWKILDYNRLLKSLNDMSEEEFLEKLGSNFTIEELEDKTHRPRSKGHISLFIQDKWYDIQIKPELLSSEEKAKNLDYQVLTDYWFKDIIGIQNIKKRQKSRVCRRWKRYWLSY